jgi:hypothetical protein
MSRLLSTVKTATNTTKKTEVKKKALIGAKQEADDSVSAFLSTLYHSINAPGKPFMNYSEGLEIIQKIREMVNLV